MIKMSDQTSENTITIKSLQKSFKNVEVLKDIDLEVKRGTMLALLGPNGAGKTTIVKILSTLLAPDEGKASVAGFDVMKEPAKVREVIGLTGQYAAVDELLTGRENLHMMGRLYHLSHSDTKRRAKELLEQFKLTDAADRPARNYSGGMRRRLDLAASLIATPPVIFLDEPTTGLDPSSRLDMWETINNLKASGTTILLTTQYLEEADQLADKIAVINGGKIVANGTAAQLKKQVGADRMEFVIAKKADLKKAEQILKNQGATINRVENSVSVTSSGGTDELYNLLGKFKKDEIGVESVSLHKPTLDDVFLKLTGSEK